MKWLIATAVALFLFSGAMPWLRRLGIGRLPGDFSFRLFGPEWSIRLMSTIVLSLVEALIARLF